MIGRRYRRQDLSAEYAGVTTVLEQSSVRGRQCRMAWASVAEADEIGTPYCVTVDFESVDDKKVTVRDRDTMKQERVATDELRDCLYKKFN